MLVLEYFTRIFKLWPLVGKLANSKKSLGLRGMRLLIILNRRIKSKFSLRSSRDFKFKALSRSIYGSWERPGRNLVKRL